jgi:hypothetical protein
MHAMRPMRSGTAPLGRQAVTLTHKQYIKNVLFNVSRETQNDFSKNQNRLASGLCKFRSFLWNTK